MVSSSILTGAFVDDKERQHPNCYVYCCSCELDGFAETERAKHFNASSIAFIDDPNTFASFVAQHLIHSLAITAGQFASGDVTCITHYGPVSYRPREPALSINDDDLDLFVFQKSPKYRVEQEFRFCWTFHC